MGFRCFHSLFCRLLPFRWIVGALVAHLSVLGILNASLRSIAMSLDRRSLLVMALMEKCAVLCVCSSPFSSMTKRLGASGAAPKNPGIGTELRSDVISIPHICGLSILQNFQNTRTLQALMSSFLSSIQSTCLFRTLYTHTRSTRRNLCTSLSTSLLWRPSLPICVLSK